MYCSNCGNEICDNDLFCPKCGKEIKHKDEWDSSRIENESRDFAKKFEEKIREAIKKGNVSRIIIRKEDKEYLNLSVNIGTAGILLGLAVALWTIVAGIVATVGYGCIVELHMDNGEVVKLNLWADNRSSSESASESDAGSDAERKDQ